MVSSHRRRLRPLTTPSCQDKAGLRDGLLQFILHAGGSLAPFAANKLAAVCSNIARLDWPQRQPNFLNVIEAALRSPATRPGALLVLSVALEQFEAVAPDFPGRDSGQVLWSRAEELQSLLSPVVPGVLAALTSALQGREREEDVLGALHTVLGGSRGGSHGSTLKQAAAGPGVGPLLDALFRLADPGRPSTSLPALRCLSLLADAALPRATAEPLQGLFLGGLTALCDRAGEGASEGWWLAASRLLALFLRRHLAAIGANEAMRPSLDALLQRSAALTFSSRDLTRVLVASEVWRAVCEALSTQQDEAWEATDPKAAEGAFFALAERLRGGLMNISDELMKGMMLGGGQGGAGGLSAASMDRGGGSGAAMEEALEEVSVASRLEAEGLENEEADGAGPEGDDNDSGR